uniref:Odorant receptor n=1 Tax=Trichogramma kaykai TaxID=54128 RepID=A0ABD2XAV5_9HYME
MRRLSRLDTSCHIFKIRIKTYNSWEEYLSCQCLLLLLLLGLNEILYFLTERLMFVIMLGSSVLLIIAGSTMVVLMDSDVPMALKMFVCCWAAMIVILFICVPGQLLTNAGHEFFIECYCVNWHGYPPKARVLLLLILVRTTKPLVLRAGFIADLSFETCSSVLKKAASYVTALRSIYTAL